MLCKWYLLKTVLNSVAFWQGVVNLSGYSFYVKFHNL